MTTIRVITEIQVEDQAATVIDRRPADSLAAEVQQPGLVMPAEKLIDDLEITHSMLRVFRALETLSQTSGEWAPTQRQIADDLRLSIRTVMRAIKQLEESGYLTVHRSSPTGQAAQPRFQYQLHPLGRG